MSRMGECFDVPLGRDETPEARRRPAQNDRRLDGVPRGIPPGRSEEHTSALQSLMRISYAVFCLKKKLNTEHTEQQDCHIHHDYLTTSIIDMTKNNLNQHDKSETTQHCYH